MIQCLSSYIVCARHIMYKMYPLSTIKMQKKYLPYPLSMTPHKTQNRLSPKGESRSSCVSNSTPADLCRCWRKSCKRGLLSKWTGSLEVSFFGPHAKPTLNPRSTTKCRHSDRASGSSSPKVPVFQDTAPHLQIFYPREFGKRNCWLFLVVLWKKSPW